MYEYKDEYEQDVLDKYVPVRNEHPQNHYEEHGNGEYVERTLDLFGGFREITGEQHAEDDRHPEDHEHRLEYFTEWDYEMRYGHGPGNGGNGSSSGSPSGEGSGDVPGGDLPSGDVPNNGEPSIPGEGGGNPPVPDSEVGGPPNGDQGVPNSGNIGTGSTNPGATNESGNVNSNGYGNCENTSNPYSYLEDGSNVGPGKDFTAAQKQKMLQENMERNGGVVKSDNPNDFFDILSKPEKSQKGVTPSPDEWQFDHIIPKDQGGTNSFSNCQIVSRKFNRTKWNN